METFSTANHCDPLEGFQKYFSTLNSSYEIKKIIGSGAYGTVCEAISLKTNQKVAIKRVTNLFLYPIETKRILREITLLRKIDHPNIIKILDLLFEGEKDSFKTIYIVMEYFPTDLKKLFRSNLFLSQMQIEMVSYQLANILNFIHSCKIIHRDLKPANILINEDCKIKLCDFGLARLLLEKTKENGVFEKEENVVGSPSNNFNENEQKNFGDSPSGDSPAGCFKEKEKKISVGSPSCNFKNMEIWLQNGFESSPDQRKRKKRKKEKNMTKHVVSRWYRPPEIILINKNYDSFIDVWSYGCIFAELQNMVKLNIDDPKKRKPIFPGSSCFPLSPEIKKDKEKKLIIKNRKDQLYLIFEWIGTPNEEEISFLTDDNSKNYVKSFSHKQKKEFDKIFPGSNEFAIQILENTLKFNPKDRFDMKKIVENKYFDGVRKKEDEIKGEPICLEFENDTSINSKIVREYFLKEIDIYKR